MIAANEDGGIRGNLGAGIVLPEGIHGAILGRDVQALQILFVPNRLEIAAAEKKVDFRVLGFLQVLKGSVHVVQVAMHAPFHRNLHSLSLPLSDRKRNPHKTLISRFCYFLADKFKWSPSIFLYPFIY